MMIAQFLLAAGKGSVDVHHPGSTPFLFVYDTFFLLAMWKPNIEVSPEMFDLCSM